VHTKVHTRGRPGLSSSASWLPRRARPRRRRRTREPSRTQDRTATRAGHRVATIVPGHYVCTVGLSWQHDGSKASSCSRHGSCRAPAARGTSCGSRTTRATTRTVQRRASGGTLGRRRENRHDPPAAHRRGCRAKARGGALDAEAEPSRALPEHLAGLRDRYLDGTLTLEEFESKVVNALEPRPTEPTQYAERWEVHLRGGIRHGKGADLVPRWGYAHPLIAPRRGAPRRR
jgi:hypothetical protein